VRGTKGLSELDGQEPAPFTIYPIRGQFDGPARLIPPGGSPDMKNCIVRSGQLRKRPGFSQWKTGNAGFGEPVTGLFSTLDDVGATHLIALCSTLGFKYNSVTDSWDALTGTAFTGTHELWSFENSQVSMVFSQGVDPVYRLPFTGLAYAILNASCPAARYLCRFNNRLNLGFTRESSVDKPWRHRRPVSGNHTDWTGVGSGFRDQADAPHPIHGMLKIGNQMALYYETAIELVSMNPNAAAPFVYERRISDVGLKIPKSLKGRNERHWFVGTDDVYEFNGVQINPIIPQVRDAIFLNLSANAHHRMFAELLMETQEYIMFLAKGSASFPTEAWVANWVSRTAYPWTLPAPQWVSDSSATIDELVGTINEQNWEIDSPQVYTGEIFARSSVIHKREEALTIDELEGTIDEQLWMIDDGAVQGGFPILLTGHGNGKVYQWSSRFLSDARIAIPCRWTSHDMTSENLFQRPGKKIVLDTISFEYQAMGAAFSLDFYVSTDGGDSWSTVETFTAPSEVGNRTGHVNIRATGDRIRFKMENITTNESFRINSFTPHLVLEETTEYSETAD
jgi:hypothetical protein